MGDVTFANRLVSGFSGAFHQMSGEFLSSQSTWRSPDELTAGTLAQLPRLFGAFGCGIVRWTESAGDVSYASHGLSTKLLEDWFCSLSPHDRVFQSVMKLQRPNHNLTLYSARRWSESFIYSSFMRRFGAHHYLAAPLYGAWGRPVGVINMYRRRDEAGFGSGELNEVATLSSYLSVTLARMRQDSGSVIGGLAPRELQVARLAARGYDNPAIATRLGLARNTVKKTLGRVYQKLHVNGRAQMACELGTAGLL